jgi:hypothetical protein
VSSTTPSKFDRERDRDSDPLLYDIAKHAKAAANHHAALRDRIVRAHNEGVDHTVIADTATVTLGVLKPASNRSRRLMKESDLVDAGG